MVIDFATGDQLVLIDISSSDYTAIARQYWA